ncbi:MAG: hypothetical protein EAZ98_04095, partial [Oscillatoriales cyanobacterium]
SFVDVPVNTANVFFLPRVNRRGLFMRSPPRLNCLSGHSPQNYAVFPKKLFFWQFFFFPRLTTHDREAIKAVGALAFGPKILE